MMIDELPEAEYWTTLDLSLHGSAENIAKMQKFLRAEVAARVQVEQERDVLRKALGNCYITAKRALSFGHQATPFTPQQMIDRKEELLRHIIQFCEETGEKSSILRATLPTEITDGTESEIPR